MGRYLLLMIPSLQDICSMHKSDQVLRIPCPFFTRRTVRSCAAGSLFQERGSHQASSGDVCPLPPSKAAGHNGATLVSACHFASKDLEIRVLCFQAVPSFPTPLVHGNSSCGWWHGGGSRALRLGANGAVPLSGATNMLYDAHAVLLGSNMEVLPANRAIDSGSGSSCRLIIGER